jgi:hypothetical protein
MLKGIIKLSETQSEGGAIQKNKSIRKNRTEISFNKVSMIHNDDFSQMNREPEDTIKYREFPTPTILLSEED